MEVGVVVVVAAAAGCVQFILRNGGCVFDFL